MFYEIISQNVWNFSADLFRKSYTIFPEISGKFPPETSGLTSLVIATHLDGASYTLSTARLAGCPTSGYSDKSKMAAI